MNPDLKECRQRGYEITYDNIYRTGTAYCEFPDGNRCPLRDFNDGTCGAEYMIEDYCVKEGEPVWDSDKCCKGLWAYLPPLMTGQARCLSKPGIISTTLLMLYYLIIANPLLSIAIVLIMGYIIFRLIKRTK